MGSSVQPEPYLPPLRVLLEDGVSNLHKDSCMLAVALHGREGKEVTLIDFGNQLDIGVRKWKDQVPTSPFFYHLPTSPSWSKPMMKQLETPAVIPTAPSTSPYPSILPLQLL